MSARWLGGALLLAGLVTGTLARATVAAAATLGAAPGADDVVAVAILGAGTLVGAWYSVTAALGLGLCAARCLGAEAATLERALVRHGAPVLRRAAVAGACAGLGVTLAVTPTMADAPPGAVTAVAAVHGERVPDDLGPGAGSAADDAPPVPAELGWGAPPPVDRTAGAPAPVVVMVSATAARDHHHVRPGDSLWSIAAAALGPGADDAAIAAEWPRWYAANVTTIGPDPDLIHPGQVLLAPSEETHP